MTDRAVFGQFFGEEGKGIDVIVAPLHLAFLEMYRSAVHARGRARLEPHDPEPEPPQAVREVRGALKSVGTRFLNEIARDGFGIEIYARADHDRAAADDAAESRLYARHGAVFREDFSGFRL